MLILFVLFLILSFLPLLVAVGFRGPQIRQRKAEINDDLRKAGVSDARLKQLWEGGRDKIAKNIDATFNPLAYFPPAFLLSLVNCAGFAFCLANLRLQYEPGGSSLPISVPEGLVVLARPLLVAFIGVYLFNLGALLRRLYLYDLTEHAFWGYLNRTLLVVGVALAISLTGWKNYLAYFSIGFLLNDFVQGVIETGFEKWGTRKQNASDQTLRNIDGINIWVQYRLEEEGIESVQNLATADAISLTIKTHYNLRTVVDWIDQSMLLDRVSDKAQILQEKCLIRGVIDLAWQSPENQGNSKTAKLIADALSIEQHFVEVLMDGLCMDPAVGAIWSLWQEEDEEDD